MQYGRFATVYDRLMADVPYDAWAVYLHGLIQKHAPNAKTVLDCACGTGEITLRLCRMGYAVTGLDLSDTMLYEAQQKCLRAGKRIPFVQQDMRRIMLHKPVDVIVCACDGANYLTSLQDVSAFLQAAFAALKPGGLLLFDVSSAYKLSHVLGCNTFAEEEDGCAYLWKNYFDEENALLEMRLTFFEKQENGQYERFSERHVQRAHTTGELLKALENAGFIKTAAYGAFTECAPEENTQRIQMIAYRP
ncbi:MAG: class I SAM-dependent methyltransferase [Eubacteriales bacterium]|nr:class I SAM-dependent methyltransferase [Eubacteriales bacterium]